MQFTNVAFSKSADSDAEKLSISRAAAPRNPFAH